MQPNRTWLFAPGNHARKVEKVFATGADVAILDLEDAVAVAEKAATRDRQGTGPAPCLPSLCAGECTGYWVYLW
jgi:citrate lyase subunit beta/citryl-CoA lyase